MSGFPLKLSRDSFGPSLRDVYAADNPETDIPAAAFNALFWQVAGMNAALPVRAVAIAEYSGGVLSTIYQAEAWNPNNDVTHPVIARTAEGVYTVTFAPSYEDETGLAVSTTLLFARAMSLASVAAFTDKREAHAWVDSGSPLVVNVTTWAPDTGLAADAKFMVEVG